MKSNIIFTVLALVLFSLSIGPTSAASVNPSDSIVRMHQTANDAGMIEDIPYVWQEINGFCYWGALTMAIKHAGIDIDMHDLFAVSGTGFSALYANSGPDMSFWPGVFLRQIWIGTSTSELLGLDADFYFDTYTEMGAEAARVLQGRGVSINHIDGEEGAFDLICNSIDLGYPLVLSVDTYYLPADDYDIVRQLNVGFEQTGVAHAVLLIGYNDTAEVAYLMDPGVGAFGENYGYPDDGRWFYNISYTQLNLAWSPTSYASVTVVPGDGQPADFSLHLRRYICNRLLGNRTSYFKGYESFYFLSVGADAFRGMSLDMTVEGLKVFLEQFEAKEQILRNLGRLLESTMTLQYLSYRTALESLPGLLPDVDFNQFLENGRQALSYMDELSHNGSMILIHHIDGSLLFNTFTGIADSYEASGNLDAAFNEYSEDIHKIADHLMAIANSWKAAGEALQRTLPPNQILSTNQLILIAGTTGVIVVVGAVIVRRRRR